MTRKRIMTTRIFSGIRLLAALIVFTVVFRATGQATEAPTGQRPPPFCEPSPYIGIVCVDDYDHLINAICRNPDCCVTCSVWPGKNCDFRDNSYPGYYKIRRGGDGEFLGACQL